MIRKTILLIFGVSIISILFFCVKENLDDKSSVITQFNVQEMVTLHLPDFELISTYPRPRFNEGNEYRFKRQPDNELLDIRVGLHQSTESAESIANDYIHNISWAMKEGPYQGILIGDKYWWYVVNDKVVVIIFIRKNALIIVSSGAAHRDISNLAKTIDDDILNDADYVELDNSIILPVIDSITATKTVLKEGETTKITIHASDPNDEPLEYISSGGVGSYEPYPKNVFTEIAMHGYIPDPFYGSHTYKFVAINQSNAVSEVSEIQIVISE